MSLPSLEELQSRLRNTACPGTPIPLPFLSSALSRLTKLYSSGLSAAVVLDELQKAWDEHSEKKDQRRMSEIVNGVAVVTGTVSELKSRGKGGTLIAVVKALQDGTFGWYVGKGFDRVVRVGMVVRLVAKVVESGRKARGLEMLLPTAVRAVLLRQKNVIGGQAVLEIVEKMTLKRVWDTRDEHPGFVSGRVIRIVKGSVGDGAEGGRAENSAYSRIILKDVQADKGSAHVDWFLDDEHDEFRFLVKVGEIVLFQKPVITPTGDSFCISISSQSQVYLVTNLPPIKPESPSSVAITDFSEKESDRPHKQRRILPDDNGDGNTLDILDD